MSSDERDWSSLPSDIAQHITKFLPVLDRIRCSTVCSSWYKVISPVELPSPWFVIPYDDGSCNFRSLTTTNDILTFTALPPTGIIIVGSQNGCIAAVDKLLNVHIVRFFSGSIKSYKLPPLTTLPEVELDPESKDWSVISRLRAIKIVFSTPDPNSKDFVALAYLNGNIIYKRAGDARWRLIPGKVMIEDAVTEDVIFHDSKFYSLTWDCQVVAYDFSTDTPRDRVIAKADVPTAFRGADKYLAFSKTGEVLIVLRNTKKVELPDGRKRCLTKECLVMRYNHSKTPNWDIVNNLGEECLLLGKNNDIVVSSFNATWIRNNCIYFGDSYYIILLEELDEPIEEALREVVVYDMEKKKTNEFFPLDFCLDKPAPVWFDSRLPSD